LMEFGLRLYASYTPTDWHKNDISRRLEHSLSDVL